MEPTKGLLTFRAEGNNSENSSYVSRVIHWPGLTAQCNKYGSGVTIGRGYDLKYRSSSEIIRDLTYATVLLAQAEEIAKAAKPSHCKAAEFVKERKSETGKITERQQLRLFEYIYDKYVSDVKRFYNKYKRAESVNWERLNPTLKDVLVDMKYQGVLTASMVPVFGHDNNEDIIRLIRTNAVMYSDEPARR